MLDDSFVKGEGCFFGGVGCTTKVYLFAINFDLCFTVPLVSLGHSIILFILFVGFMIDCIVI